MEPLFRSAAQITPAVITTVLRAGEATGQASVVSVQIEPITGRAAFNAQLYRLHLSYDQWNKEFPDSLVAKLPTDNVDLHENAALFQPGRKETWFYRHAAKRTPIYTPRCYYNALDRATGGSILLLEDLAPAQNGNQLAGASMCKAKLALKSAARLHAAWWGNDGFETAWESDGFQAHSAEAENRVQQLFRQAWPHFLDGSTIRMSGSVRQFGDYLMDRMSDVPSLLEHSPKTLIHGDFRLDNMLFGQSGADMVCWLIDWEDIACGNCACDVAWFIGGCLDIKNTGEEQTLLKFYYKALVREGVSEYTWAACQRDYQVAMCDAFVQGVLMATVDKPKSTYHRQLAEVIGRRFIHACERLHLHTLIDA